MLNQTGGLILLWPATAVQFCVRYVYNAHCGVLLVTNCLLLRIWEFIHTQHCNITLGLRLRVVLRCFAWINSRIGGSKQGVGNLSHAQSIFFVKFGNVFTAWKSQKPLLSCLNHRINSDARSHLSSKESGRRSRLLFPLKCESLPICCLQIIKIGATSSCHNRILNLRFLYSKSFLEDGVHNRQPDKMAMVRAYISSRLKWMNMSETLLVKIWASVWSSASCYHFNGGDSYD